MSLYIALCQHHLTQWTTSSSSQHFVYLLIFKTLLFKFPLYLLLHSFSLLCWFFLIFLISKIDVLCSPLHLIFFSVYKDLNSPSLIALRYHLYAVNTQIYRSIPDFPSNPGFYILNCLLIFCAFMSNRYLKLSMSTKFPILPLIFSPSAVYCLCK